MFIKTNLYQDDNIKTIIFPNTINNFLCMGNLFGCFIMVIEFVFNFDMGCHYIMI